MEYLDVEGKEMPLVGLGCFSLHGKVLIESLTTALEEGYELFDTAFKYDNEKEIGRCITSNTIKREGIIIQTKVCARQLLGSKMLFWLDKKSISSAFEYSCKRLGRDYIDVYLIHSPFVKVANYYKKLVELKDAGKIGIIGVCNFNREQLQTIKSVTGGFPMFNQIEIHPYHNSKELVAFCRDNGIVVEARSPFAHGDALHDWLANEALQKIANEYNKSVPQIILRWVTQQNVIALPRSKTSQHIKDNINIFDFSLTGTQVSVIDKLNRDQSYGFVSSVNL